MATNLDLSPELCCEAQRLGNHKTKKAAVTAALEEYVRRRNRKDLKIFDLVGKVEYYDDYDVKEFRRRDMKRIVEE